MSGWKKRPVIVHAASPYAWWLMKAEEQNLTVPKALKLWRPSLDRWIWKLYWIWFNFYRFPKSSSVTQLYNSWSSQPPDKQWSYSRWGISVRLKKVEGCAVYVHLGQHPATSALMVVVNRLNLSLYLHKSFAIRFYVNTTWVKKCRLLIQSGTHIGMGSLKFSHGL